MTGYFLWALLGRKTITFSFPTYFIGVVCLFVLPSNSPLYFSFLLRLCEHIPKPLGLIFSLPHFLLLALSPSFSWSCFHPCFILFPIALLSLLFIICLPIPRHFTPFLSTDFPCNTFSLCFRSSALSLQWFCHMVSFLYSKWYLRISEGQISQRREHQHRNETSQIS